MIRRALGKSDTHQCREEIQNGGRCELLCLGWRGWRKIKEVATESWFPRGQQGVQSSARGEVVAGSGPSRGTGGRN